MDLKKGNLNDDKFIYISEKIITTYCDINPFLIRQILFNPRSIVFCFIYCGYT